MTIDKPSDGQIPQLRSLWKEAFGDTDEFLQIFFSRGFAPERCRCITQNGAVTAALYWFDCQWEGRQLAYLYAVATAKAHQGKGLCRTLMENTHRHLQALGYAGAVLVPGSKELFSLYEKLGYEICSFVRQFTCTADAQPVPLQQVDAARYALARRQLLPENSVIQEGAALDFLSVYANLYVGAGFVLAAYPDDGNLVVCELLGDPKTAPQILAALGFPRGTFRIPGQEMPFAMYRSLRSDCAMPGYFGLALD